jgi:uncharacterized repeat protein (TIGR03803 family)
MGKLNWAKRACFALLVCATTAIALPAQSFTALQSGSITPATPNETIALPAQTFETLHSFDGTDGTVPYAGLVQATDGNFYGTTTYGGVNSFGTVFKITPGGTVTTLYAFCSQIDCAGGNSPYAGLVQATDGNFYGTTFFNGANGGGTVFKITPGGTLRTLYSFCSQTDCADGLLPEAGLVQGTDGNLYGTTFEGGANSNGTIFKITPGGALTTLYSFCSQSGCTDGNYPAAGLIQAADGNFYGTTVKGGANGYGTVFKITPSGTLTTLYSFCSQSGCTDGENANAGLVQGTDGNFYGTTPTGGASGYGTVFEITSGGTLTTLYSFCSQSACTDGTYPGEGGLVQATDGNFYGTTSGGGANTTVCGGYGCGTVFKITPFGNLTTLHSFDLTDGAWPYARLVQDTNGNFYGTTTGGGAKAYGTVFSLSVGLPPFVETQPTSDWVGAAVKILGNNLEGATGVMFNGHAAVFKVVSSSLITTAVPAGATTGLVDVVTPSGTLLSNVPFRVVPCPSCFSPGGPGGEGPGN